MIKTICLSVALSSFIMLTACSFEPMAATSTKSYDNKRMSAAVASVSVQAESPPQQRMITQIFRTALEDIINPGGQEATTNDYTLHVVLNPIISPGLIAPDGKAQRYLVMLNSTYTLTRNADGKIIEQGMMNRNSSYSNLPNSYYSTYIAEQDTMKRLNQELATQYGMKLASLLTAPPLEASELPPTLPPTLQPLNPNATFDLPGLQP